MVNPLPAILIGGPPHAGKSVLTYNLTQALRKRNVAHYVLRANPDGEGDWSQEMNQDKLDFVRVKGKWTPEFVTRICADLECRQLPLLVDVGGQPKDEQMCLFRYCSHALLLLHHEEESTRRWLELVQRNNLSLLAQVYSRLSGISTISSLEPIIEGPLVGLNRGSLEIQGPLFDALVERIYELFVPYATEGLVKTHLDVAPAEYIVNLDTLIQNWAPQTRWWEPVMIQRLLDQLPAQTPLAVYGRGPTWLYGALAAHAGMQPFHQFSSRLGWIIPPLLQISTRSLPEICMQCDEREEATVITMNIITKHLDYSQSQHLPFPSVPTDRGLIISGVIPQWLLTALVRLYSSTGVAWIAYHYPPDKESRAVVMYSHVAAYIVGDLVLTFQT